MSDRESESDEEEERLLASLRQREIPGMPGLGERVSARIRSELLRRDLLDLFAGGPAQLLRQLLRRRAPRGGSDAAPPSASRRR